MAITETDVHIVMFPWSAFMFPWSAFGHMIPFYQLSISLAKKGVRVSYVSTPKNVERLPNIPPNLSHLMQFVILPLPVAPEDTNLPKGAEATVDVNVQQVHCLVLAYLRLYQPFKEFITSNSPDWIISDFVAEWMPDVARECNVPLMFFSVFSANTTSLVNQPGYRVEEGHQEMVRSSIEDTSRLRDPRYWGRRMSLMSQRCDAVCVRSCREFEAECLEMCRNLIRKPVLPTGVLPPDKVEQQDSRKTDGKWEETFTLLDQQLPRSAIYVGFGSEYKLSKDEIFEIAYGLELSQLPFIWALRRPIWAVDDSEVLPPGFAIRVKDKGVVRFGWAPQLEILGHPSIGGSLFHSGWGSIVETLQFGHSLIVLPFIYDQVLNARVVVDKGLGVEVARREDGSFTKDDVAEALRRAMVGDEAERIKGRTSETAKIFGDHELHQDYYIGELVEYLRKEVRSQ